VGGLSLALAGALAIVGPARLIAQIEGERGIIPMARSTDIEVTGIEVNTTGKTGQEAREAGWREAYKKAWAILKGPSMPDGQIETMVSAVVIEHEQIGPHRYIAKLTVTFDRTKAGQFVGGGDPTAQAAHSAPMLIIPVLYSGGVAQVYEVRGPWQKAWAEFRAGTSPIDYVRPVGSGGDSLLITAGQTTRRSRLWWRNVLDTFGASDVVMPIARLERQWPGGPVRGYFTARYGPDNTFLASFALTANDEAGVPAMLNQAVTRFDAIYGQALSQGLLTPDPTLNAQRLAVDPAVAALIAAAQAAERAAAAEREPRAATSPTASPTPSATATSSEPVALFVYVATRQRDDLDAALSAVRGAPGVRGASVGDADIGGTSLIRLSSSQDIQSLAAALRARGYAVSVGPRALNIRR